MAGGAGARALPVCVRAGHPAAPHRRRNGRRCQLVGAPQRDRPRLPHEEPRGAACRHPAPTRLPPAAPLGGAPRRRGKHSTNRSLDKKSIKCFHNRPQKRATKVITLASVRNTWEQRSRLLWLTVRLKNRPGTRC